MKGSSTMSHRHQARNVRIASICVAALLASLPAAAQFLNPVGTTTGVEAFAVNSYIQPGTARNQNGSGPLADAASELYGLNTADSAAAVDAAGLHASSAVHGDSTNPSFTASARSFTSLVDPFIIVPRAGFTGTQALLRIPFSFGGTINLFPSLQACSTCFGLVQASLGVDGMTDQFFFLGASSQGTIANPTFISGGVSRSGILEGLVPVNTELYLRAGLLTQVHCQSDATLSCGSEALFGGTLSFDGFSTDAVDIVWGLTPSPLAAVPEPSTWALMIAGLLAVGRIARRGRG
jgi:hypothetical protein